MGSLLSPVVAQGDHLQLHLHNDNNRVVVLCLCAVVCVCVCVYGRMCLCAFSSNSVQPCVFSPPYLTYSLTQSTPRPPVIRPSLPQHLLPLSCASTQPHTHTHTHTHTHVPWHDPSRRTANYRGTALNQTLD